MIKRLVKIADAINLLIHIFFLFAYYHALYTFMNQALFNNWNDTLINVQYYIS